MGRAPLNWAASYHLLFLTYIIGAFVAIDATFFAGQYRTAALTVSWPAVWQDVNESCLRDVPKVRVSDAGPRISHCS